LNVKYVIVPPLPEDLSGLSPVEQNMVEGLKRYLQGYPLAFRGSHAVYRNPDVLPRAYVVHAIEVVTDAEEALKRVFSTEFDPHRSVVLERDPGVFPADDGLSLSPVSIQDYGPHRMVCEVELVEPGFLVVSGNYHPDWMVSVDGAERDLFHADYIGMGTPLAAGAHIVVFEYRSTPFRVGMVLTFLAFGLFAILVFTAVRERSDPKP
jgi:hypothetical protein